VVRGCKRCNRCCGALYVVCMTSPHAGVLALVMVAVAANCGLCVLRHCIGVVAQTRLNRCCMRQARLPGQSLRMCCASGAVFVPSNAAVLWWDCEFGWIRWLVGWHNWHALVRTQMLLAAAGLFFKGLMTGEAICPSVSWGLLRRPRATLSTAAGVMFMLGGLACAGQVLSGSHLSVHVCMLTSRVRHVALLGGVAPTCVSPHLFLGTCHLERCCASKCFAAPLVVQGVRAPVVGLLCSSGLR